MRLQIHLFISHGKQSPKGRNSPVTGMSKKTVRLADTTLARPEMFQAPLLCVTVVLYGKPRRSIWKVLDPSSRAMHMFKRLWTSKARKY